MQTPYSFDLLILFGFLSILLLIGTAIRAKVKMIQRFLFPSCIVGGIIGMVLLNTRLLPIDFHMVEAFAYHCFNISFISVGLAGGEKVSPFSREFFKGSMWMALVQGVTFPLQAIIGGGAVLIFGLLGTKLFPTFGFLAPLSFNEGPGQALTLGRIWEAHKGLPGFENGFENGPSIGLTLAAFGILFSLMVGVPIANWGIRRGMAHAGKVTLPPDFLKGVYAPSQEKESAGNLTTHSSNIDSLAFQAALIGLVYVLGYSLVTGLSYILPGEIINMLWVFFFFIGMFIAMLVRAAMAALKTDYLIDDGVQGRLTGWSVDYLIVATCAGIQFQVIMKYLAPIISICIIGGTLTTLIVIYMGRKLPSYSLERMVAIFGTTMGTVPCGLLLLRICDPKFKTPVSMEIAVMNIFAAPIVLLLTLLTNAPLWWHWSLELTLGIYAGAMVVSWIFIKLLIERVPVHITRPGP